MNSDGGSGDSEKEGDVLKMQAQHSMYSCTPF